MKIVSLEGAQGLTGQLKHWAYNGLDCTGTREIADVLLPQLDAQTARTYAFERAAQGPAMAMMRRGIKVDEPRRKIAVNDLKREWGAKVREIQKLDLVRENFDMLEKDTGSCPKATRKDGKHKWQRGVEDTPERLCEDCGASRFKVKPFNPNSDQQVKYLLYDKLKAPLQKNKDGKLSTDGEALDRIGRQRKKLAPLTGAIDAANGLKKQIGFLNARLTGDNRFPSSFNVGTAWTGRWSSSKNAYGEGGNAQNIAERHRRIFLADAGKKLCYADLKQAESNIVAHLAGDEEYINAHKSGDVHTYVTRLVWPDLPWTGDLKKDKAIAKQNPDWDQAEGHNFRFQAKRIQHGSNYGLSPFGISMIAHIPLAAAKEAYLRYMDAFPRIPDWHSDVKRRVEAEEALVNPLGRKVRLFGRPWDGHTLKQGLAFLPQSTVADIINIGAWRIWQDLDPKFVELLAQIHDAILFQYPEDNEAVVQRAVDLMTVPVPVTDITGKTRVATIETEAAVGWNWGHASDDNPKGLVEII